MTVLLFILTIVVLVGIHELGHFLAARAFGVFVYEFSIGMGPILASRKLGETLYAVRLIPIGGYVRMAGEDRLETGETIPAGRILYNKRPYVRALISLTGPMMNFVLALVVILAVAWSASVPVIQVAATVPGSPAAGVLLPGDRILAIDSEPIYATSDITRALATSEGRPVVIVVRRDGVEQTVAIQPREATGRSGYELGVVLSPVAQTRRVTAVDPVSPLGVAGIQAGDSIVGVGGRETATGYDVQTALTRALESGDVIPMEVYRDGESLDFFVRAGGRTAAQILDGVTLGNYGVDSRRPGFRDGLTLGWRSFATYASLLGQTLKGLVSGSAEARDSISGPVGIAAILGQSWSFGFVYFLQILGLLSLNFAIINLIPFPGLDGSRIVFAVIEWIRGKPIPPQREGLIHAIGFVLMLVLLVVVTYRDILRLLG
jgi:regulator of sigma E protease